MRHFRNNLFLFIYLILQIFYLGSSSAYASAKQQGHQFYGSFTALLNPQSINASYNKFESTPSSRIPPVPRAPAFPAKMIPQALSISKHLLGLDYGALLTPEARVNKQQLLNQFNVSFEEGCIKIPLWQAKKLSNGELPTVKFKSFSDMIPPPGATRDELNNLVKCSLSSTVGDRMRTSQVLRAGSKRNLDAFIEANEIPAVVYFKEKENGEKKRKEKPISLHHPSFTDFGLVTVVGVLYGTQHFRKPRFFFNMESGKYLCDVPDDDSEEAEAGLKMREHHLLWMKAFLESKGIMSQIIRETFLTPQDTPGSVYPFEKDHKAEGDDVEERELLVLEIFLPFSKD